MKISELQAKDVVSISDGKRLGNIGDLEINLQTGKIEAIITGGPGRVLGLFGRDEELTISWNSILKIGEDVILVRYKDITSLKYTEEE